MKTLIRFLSCTALLWAAPGLFATQPNQWTVSTPDEFLEGELKGVSVTGDGGIVLAPALDQVLDTQEAFVYAVTSDGSGNVYIGTGNQGKIFRIGNNGQGAEWAKLNEAGVHALAVDSSNRLYAASSPDGKVYRFDNGPTPQTFFDPDEKYIWSLAIDAQNNVYVGTGPKGIIYKVNPQGQSEVFYDSQETHIVTLKMTPEGQLLAGTSPKGLLFRFTPDGKPFVLYDSGLNEMKAIAVDRYGNVYAAALEGTSATSTTEESATDTKPKDASPAVRDKSDEDETVQVGGDPKGKKTEVYRIGKNNLVETIYTAKEGLPYDLVVRADGTLLLATSNKGRIVAIDPRRSVTYLVQTPEEQVTQLMERSGRLYAATSNLGKVFLIGAKPTAAAVYESKVFDAGVTAGWGVIRWRARGGGSLAGMRVYTRSGNTSTADQTWAAWDGPYADTGSAPIKSAPARFLQWKVEFPEKAGALSASLADGVDLVTVAYQQQNLPPQLTDLTVHAAGVAFAEYPGVNPGAGLSPGGPDRAHLQSLPRSVREIDRTNVSVPPRRIYYPGARSLSWTANDPNQDDLVYTVAIRRQGENNWLVLKNDLRDTHYTIDGASLPSGTYFARVTASDRTSNPAGQGLDAQLISRVFIIANSAPTVELGQPQVQGRAVTVPFTCRSTASTIHQTEYAIDTNDWEILFPNDGIADTEAEQYTLKVENLSPGEHQILIRVTDSVGNLSTARATVTVQ